MGRLDFSKNPLTEKVYRIYLRQEMFLDKYNRQFYFKNFKGQDENGFRIFYLERSFPAERAYGASSAARPAGTKGQFHRTEELHEEEIYFSASYNLDLLCNSLPSSRETASIKAVRKLAVPFSPASSKAASPATPIAVTPPTAASKEPSREISAAV